jgi:hypothetical protein
MSSGTTGCPVVAFNVGKSFANADAAPRHKANNKVAEWFTRIFPRNAAMRAVEDNKERAQFVNEGRGDGRDESHAGKNDAGA